MREEVVVSWQMLACQFDSLQMKDLSGIISTLHFDILSSLFSFLYFQLIFRDVTSRLPSLNRVSVAMVKQHTDAKSTSSTIFGAERRQQVSVLSLAFILRRSRDMSSLRENSSRKEEDFCRPSKLRSPFQREWSSFLIFLALLSVLFFQKYMLRLHGLTGTSSARTVTSVDSSTSQAGVAIPLMIAPFEPTSPRYA